MNQTVYEAWTEWIRLTDIYGQPFDAAERMKRALAAADIYPPQPGNPA